MKRLLALLLLLTVAFCAPAAAETARRPLASGDTGEAVAELQQRLQDLGLSTGEADGIYGKQTAAGVTEAQRLLAAAGYDVAQTGEADADTLTLLFDPEAEATLRTLRLGSQGDRVRQLQSRLIDLKLLSDDADGVYGNNTEAAVRLFQQRMIQLGLTGLTLDGVATPGLVDLMMSDLSVYGFEALRLPSWEFLVTGNYVYLPFRYFHNFRSRNDLHARAGKPPAVTRAAHRFSLRYFGGGIDLTF